MSTLKTDVIEAATGTNTDLSLDGKGTGVPDLGAGFKVAGTAGVPAASIRDDAITTAKILDANVTTAKINDDAVTLAKMAAGTDGNLISYDASGNPVAIATGTDGQVLTSTGAGSPPAFEDAAGGGAWTLIGTAVASDSASLTITGLDSTYASYRFQINDIVAASAGSMLNMRIGDSGGIDSGASDYAYMMQKSNSDSTSFTVTKAPSADHIKILDAVNSNAYGGAASGTIAQGFDGTNECNISGYGNCRSTAAEQTGGVFIAGRKGVITVTQVQVYLSTGNIASGRFTVWGVKHS